MQTTTMDKAGFYSDAFTNWEFLNDPLGLVRVMADFASLKGNSFRGILTGPLAIISGEIDSYSDNSSPAIEPRERFNRYARFLLPKVRSLYQTELASMKHCKGYEPATLTKMAQNAIDDVMSEIGIEEVSNPLNELEDSKETSYEELEARHINPLDQAIMTAASKLMTVLEAELGKPFAACSRSDFKQLDHKVLIAIVYEAESILAINSDASTAFLLKTVRNELTACR